MGCVQYGTYKLVKTTNLDIRPPITCVCVTCDVQVFVNSGTLSQLGTHSAAYCHLGLAVSTLCSRSMLSGAQCRVTCR